MFGLNDNSKIYRQMLGEPIGEGLYGEVYKHGNIAIKRFYDTYYGDNNIDIEMFNKLKEINNRCFIDLLDCDTKVNGISTIYLPNNRKIKKEKVIVTSYSSRFIEESKVKSIDKNVDYTLESLYEMMKLLQELNNKGIIIWDAHGDNCIASDNEIVIIDPDQYKFSEDTEIINLRRIKDYVSDLWRKELFGDKRSIEYFELKNILFKGSLDETINNIKHEVGNKTPREYLDKKLKRTRN